jgi:hypothetical protein
MHSSLDADRLDYLMRDAIHTGVRYGLVDFDYLIRHLEIGEEKGSQNETIKVIGVSQKAVHVLEHYLTSRYFLYSQVIFHKTVIAFETLAKNIMYEAAFRKEKLMEGWFCNYDEIKAAIDTPEFLRFDDRIFFQLLYHPLLRENKRFQLMAEMLLRRNRPKMIKEVKSLTRTNENRHTPEFINFRSLLNKGLANIAQKANIDFEDLFSHEISLSFENMSPYLNVSDTLSEEDKKEAARVIDKNGSARLLIEDQNSVIHHLGMLKLTTLRLYSLDNDKTVCENLLKEVEKILT